MGGNTIRKFGGSTISCVRSISIHGTVQPNGTPKLNTFDDDDVDPIDGELIAIKGGGIKPSVPRSGLRSGHLNSTSDDSSNGDKVPNTDQIDTTAITRDHDSGVSEFESLSNDSKELLQTLLAALDTNKQVQQVDISIARRHESHLKSLSSEVTEQNKKCSYLYVRTNANKWRMSTAQTSARY